MPGSSIENPLMVTESAKGLMLILSTDVFLCRTSKIFLMISGLRTAGAMKKPAIPKRTKKTTKPTRIFLKVRIMNPLSLLPRINKRMTCLRGFWGGHGFNALHNPLAGIGWIYDRIDFEVRGNIDGFSSFTQLSKQLFV